MKISIKIILCLSILLCSCGKKEIITNQVSYTINGEKIEHNDISGYHAFLDKTYDKDGQLFARSFNISAYKIFITALDSSMTKQSFRDMEVNIVALEKGGAYKYQSGFFNIKNNVDYDSDLIIAEFAAIIVNERDITNTIKIENGKLQMSLSQGAFYQKY